MKPDTQPEFNKPIHAIDINLNKVESSGIAYIRMDDHFMEFMQKIFNDHKVLGFAWEGTRNFGIILGEKDKAKKK